MMNDLKQITFTVMIKIRPLFQNQIIITQERLQQVTHEQKKKTKKKTTTVLSWADGNPELYKVLFVSQLRGILLQGNHNSKNNQC